MGELSFTELRNCLDCGKCTGSCPVAQASGGLSPRRVIRESLAGSPQKAAEAARSCLTCRRCDLRCPAGIPYTDMVLRLRTEYDQGRPSESESHCGIFSLLARVQTASKLKPRRLGWLTDDLETDAKSDTLLWIGCAPHYAAYFDQWGEEILNGPRAAVKILNRLGIKPALSEAEKCCGHDALWNGDEQTFTSLAQENLKWLARSKAKRIIFYCPTCALALRKEIPERVGAVEKEMFTFSEFLAQRVEELSLGQGPGKVTWHDPCRLGRHGGIYDEPRAVLKAIPGVDLREMPRNRAGSQCCGGGNWGHCDRVTRSFQIDRLTEARETGATKMVTSCPRCLIHLRCALEAGQKENGGEEDSFQLVHLARLLAEASVGGE